MQVFGVSAESFEPAHDCQCYAVSGCMDVRMDGIPANVPEVTVQGAQLPVGRDPIGLNGGVGRRRRRRRTVGAPEKSELHPGRRLSRRNGGMQFRRIHSEDCRPGRDVRHDVRSAGLVHRGGIVELRDSRGAPHLALRVRPGAAHRIA